MWTSFRRTRNSLAGFTLAFAFVGCLPAFAQDKLPASGAAQIQALLQEKASRTPAQQKLDSQIIYNSKTAKGQSIAAGLNVSFTPAALETSRTGLIHVDITGTVTTSLLGAITASGGQIEASFAQFKAIRAWLPISAAEALAGRADVSFIRPAELRLTNSGLRSAIPGLRGRQANIRAQLSKVLPAFATTGGSLPNVGPDTSGVKAHGANIVQAAGITGTGVKIGVLSDGVTSLASEQAAGRLPPVVTVIPGQGNIGPGPCPGSSCPDEGTAMLEIVYSIAPGAQLFFATADPSQAQFAANILALQAAGCNMIVDDVTYFAEPVFQDGTIAKAVNTVTAAGALYFSSAANSGNLDSNTSGTWEGDFNGDGAAPVNTEAGIVHSFGATDYDILTTKGFVYLLQWSDPFGAACNDYDLFILNPAGTVLEAASTNTQSCTQDPIEGIGDSGGIALNSRIVIVKYNGAARALHLDTQRGRLSIGTAGNTFGHNSGAHTLTVAAVDVATAGGGIFVGGTTNPPEYFSSDGPRKIFYDPTGAPITPGNFLFGTNGGTTLAKVDFTAANGVPVGVPGFSPFFGTSAAAPHAAAIAALIKSANPALTASQITNILYSTSLHVSNFLPRTVGSGILMANLGVAAAVGPDLTISKSHTGNFTQGQTGATYTITVTNSGAGPTSGTVTVTDSLPAGLTATAIAGTGWTCTVATLTCTTSAVEAAGASFPAITLTVNVSGSASASVTNTATASGGGETNANNDTAMDPTTIVPAMALTPDLVVTKSHSGNFTQGQTGATYTITVMNLGPGATAGTVTVVDTLPAGLTATALSGTGWTCTLATLTCTNSTVEAGGASFPAITVTVNVSASAAATVTNSATASGGGETNTTNDTANDPTTIAPSAPTPPLTDSFQVRYAANLNAGDSFVDITNTGTSGGNLCANVYTFDPAEELISCCTCSVTPNGLQSLSVRNSLISNPLTPSIPTAVVIKIVATTGTCSASTVTANSLASGLRAWGTTLHTLTSAPLSYGVTETPFSNSALSAAELQHLTSFCGFIQADGSGFGVCKGCAGGGLASTLQ